MAPSVRSLYIKAVNAVVFIVNVRGAHLVQRLRRTEACISPYLGPEIWLAVLFVSRIGSFGGFEFSVCRLNAFSPAVVAGIEKSRRSSMERRSSYLRLVAGPLPLSYLQVPLKH